jgi:hypothetical protein
VVDTDDGGLVEPFDSDLGSARVDRGEVTGRQSRPAENGARRDTLSGGHPEDAEEQGRPRPLDEMVGTAGPGSGEPSGEHGSSGQDSGSMDATPVGGDTQDATAGA